MKNGDVIELYETLQRISENKELKFNVALGYAMAKNKEKLRQEATIIYKMRRDIIMEHGKIDGKDITVPAEYVDEVNKKINDLMEIENDIQLTQVPIELFSDIELNMEDIEGLSGMIQAFEFTELPVLQEKTPE